MDLDSTEPANEKSSVINSLPRFLGGRPMKKHTLHWSPLMWGFGRTPLIGQHGVKSVPNPGTLRRIIPRFGSIVPSLRAQGITIGCTPDLGMSLNDLSHAIQLEL